MASPLPLLALMAIASVADLPNPRARGVWVEDAAGVLDVTSEARMNETLAALERRLGVEIAVVTVDDVPGTPKEFATALFGRFRIGKREANNGLLVLLVLGQRRLEMETGYGLEPLLPDGWLGVMQAEIMVPRFRTGDYGGGLTAGIEQIVARLDATPEAARRGVEVPVVEGADEAPAGAPLPILPVGAGVGGGALVAAALVRRHRKLRTCDKCKIRLVRLTEEADDAHLTSGQRTEEAVGSVAHDVFQCGSCGLLRHLSRRAWLTSYARCAACRHRTAREVGRETLVPATQRAPGRERISVACAHCHDRRTFERELPQLPRPTEHRSGIASSSGGRSSGGGSSSTSSRGSSSGGSFGGGGSRGGGAGSSW